MCQPAFAGAIRVRSFAGLAFNLQQRVRAIARFGKLPAIASAHRALPFNNGLLHELYFHQAAADFFATLDGNDAVLLVFIFDGAVEMMILRRTI